MTTHPTLLRRAGIVARWPLGMGLAGWRYLWRTLPVYRDDAAGDHADSPPPLSATHEFDQPVEKGIGPLVHRRYLARITDAELSPEALISRLAGNPNRAAPIEVAVFIKTQGDDGPMRIGDEYVVRMPGPWDGPVRVSERTPTSFRFATLDGHLEAGQIEFRAHDDGGAVVFVIESWARSGDRFSHLLYSQLRVAKEMQFHMWTHFCERAARLAGGRLPDGVRVTTRQLDELEGHARVS